MNDNRTPEAETDLSSSLTWFAIRPVGEASAVGQIKQLWLQPKAAGGANLHQPLAEHPVFLRSLHGEEARALTQTHVTRVRCLRLVSEDLMH